MTLVITRVKPEERIEAARLMADTMAGFGVVVLGAGDEELELRALAHWFARKGNRFSHEFAYIARWQGEPAGMILCFSGQKAGHLSLACRHSIREVYTWGELAKLIWRGMVLGHTREAEDNEFLIAHVAVFEQFRRMGIATALLERAVAEAREEGFTRVLLQVEIGNNPAIECYQRFGFVTQFTTRFGRHADLLQCPGYHKMLLKI
jgi:ribosomal protein S18 acetylase RimI-like enzyme